jgi:hypothetical protein
VNQSNNKKRNIAYQYAKPIVLLIILLLSLAIQMLYVVFSHFGNVFDVFIFTVPFYIILCILTFIPRVKLSWTPISLFLFSVYCLFNTYFNSSSSPIHKIFIMLLGISVLFDFAYYMIDTYFNSVILGFVKNVLLIMVNSIITVSGTFLLYGIFSRDWVFTPFSHLLHQVYIPFSIAIIAMCFLYYTFLILISNTMLSKEKIVITKGIIFSITFILTLIMMIIPMF